jgi:dTDP-4-dehydrorhamnose reductase
MLGQDLQQALAGRETPPAGASAAPTRDVTDSGTPRAAAVAGHDVVINARLHEGVDDAESQ